MDLKGCQFCHPLEVRRMAIMAKTLIEASVKGDKNVILNWKRVTKMSQKG